jgi:beta-glucanase (GH16 family)
MPRARAGGFRLAALSQQHATTDTPHRRTTPRCRALGVAGLVAIPILLCNTPGNAATTPNTLTTGNWFVKSGTSLTNIGGPYGSKGLRVTNTARARTTAVLNDRVNSFVNTVAGRTYVVNAWVRTTDAVGTTVGIRQMEFRGSIRGSAQSTVWLRDRNWHHLTTRYRAATSGAQIDVNALDWGLAAHGSFDIAGIRLTSVGSASVVQPPPPPVPSPGPTPAPGQAGAPAGYHMVWSDEFNRSGLDPASWNVLNNSTYGDGNNELACLTNRPQNIAESNGVLRLQARRESGLKCGNYDRRFPQGRNYSSAMINTQGKRTFKYGYFEIRAKLPTQTGSSQGLWPAFWLRPAHGGIGELDVLEAIGSAQGSSTEVNKVHQTIWYDYNGTYPKQTNVAPLRSGSATSGGYHTYAIKWAPGLLQWIVDGHVTYTRTAATTPWLDRAFNQPFYFRLNLSVGGSWPGSPSAGTNLPASYAVDYIHVYQR